MNQDNLWRIEKFDLSNLLLTQCYVGGIAGALAVRQWGHLVSHKAAVRIFWSLFAIILFAQEARRITPVSGQLFMHEVFGLILIASEILAAGCVATAW